MPPLLLDDEEAIATAVSLLAGAGSGDAALRALTKLDRVLPTRLRHEVRALSGSVVSFDGSRAPIDPDVLMTLARACRDEVEAGFDYPFPTASLGVGSKTMTPTTFTIWVDGGPTNLRNLTLLCGFHHRLIHHGDWEVQIAADGLPEFIPPQYLDPLRKTRRNTLPA